MFDVSIYLSLITYAGLIVLMIMQIVKTKRWGEPVAWLMFGIHGFIMILTFIIDNFSGGVDAKLYNLWSNAVHLQGIATLLSVEIMRYIRMSRRGI
jgi:hypothetical protein